MAYNYLRYHKMVSKIIPAYRSLAGCGDGTYPRREQVAPPPALLFCRNSTIKYGWSFNRTCMLREAIWMCSVKYSPEPIRTMIAWPSGPPGRLFKEEGVQPPPENAGPPGRTSVPARVGGKSGDPDNPRPPTREEFIKLLKGCDTPGGNNYHLS